MTRVSERLLVQRAEDLIVLADEFTGEEVTFPVKLAAQVTETVGGLCGGEVPAGRRPLQFVVVIPNGGAGTVVGPFPKPAVARMWAEVMLPGTAAEVVPLARPGARADATRDGQPAPPGG